MTREITTRYGVLGRDTAGALGSVLATVLRDNVAALGSFRQRNPPAPSDYLRGEDYDRRGQALLDELFPPGTVLLSARLAATPAGGQISPSGEEARTVRRLLTTAASFLAAEVSLLDPCGDSSELHGVRAWVNRLLDNAEDGTWWQLLESA